MPDDFCEEKIHAFMSDEMNSISVDTTYRQLYQDYSPGSSYGMGIDNIARRSSIGHVILLVGNPPAQSEYVTIPQQASVKAESSSSASMQRRANSMLSDTSRWKFEYVVTFDLIVF
jgi:hypothetical protein